MAPSMKNNAQKQPGSFMKASTGLRDFSCRKNTETGTYNGEVHDFEDPDCQRQVDQDQDHQQQDEEVKAAFPPAVDSHFVHLWFL